MYICMYVCMDVCVGYTEYPKQLHIPKHPFILPPPAPTSHPGSTISLHNGKVGCSIVPVHVSQEQVVASQQRSHCKR